MSAKTHVTWIDAAKGWGISLVVFGHVLGGVLARGWLGGLTDLGHHVYEYIYLFHMPLFFMISGLFFFDYARENVLQTLLSRVGGIAWPSLLWDFAIRSALLPIIGLFMLTPPRIVPIELVYNFLTGESSWFLWTLFAVEIIALPFARWPVWLLFGISVFAFLIVGERDLGPLSKVVHFAPFFFVGGLLRPCIGSLEIRGTFPQFLAALLLFAIVAAIFYLGLTQISAVAVLCGVLGSLGSFCLVQCVGSTVQNRILAPLGTASLAIYVLHPYLQGVSREVLLHTVGASGAVQLIGPTVFALVGGYWIFAGARRYGCAWLFRLRIPLPAAQVSQAP